jgi:hypothetical protein
VRLWIIAAVVVASTAVQAQQSPSEQALGNKLMAEINAALQCDAGLISARQELAKSAARIKELEDKYEPKDKTK